MTGVGARLVCGAVAAGLGVILGCGGPSSTPEVDESAALERPVAVEEVTTIPVRRGQIRTVITAAGSIVARRSTPVGPAVPGRIVHIFVDVGDEVPFEGPLFQIDPAPYAIALDEAKAGVALARAEVREARDEEERTRQLAGKQAISDQDHRRARTRVAMSEARVEQARARAARVEHDLSRTLVRAPYAGSIVERRAHEGIMATVQPNTTVVVLQESGALEALLDIPEASGAPVRPGDPVRLHVEGLVEPISSEVRAVSDRIDAKTRTYAIRVPLEDAGGTIKAGAFVRAEIEPTPRPGALVVPREAIARREGRTYLFRSSDGVAERVPVRVGVVGREEAEVLSGIALDDAIIIGHVVSRLGDGDPIRVVATAPLQAQRPAPPEDSASAEEGRP